MKQNGKKNSVLINVNLKEKKYYWSEKHEVKKLKKYIN